jgi:hypothetical protein
MKPRDPDFWNSGLPTAMRLSRIWTVLTDWYFRGGEWRFKALDVLAHIEKTLQQMEREDEWTE